MGPWHAPHEVGILAYGQSRFTLGAANVTGSGAGGQTASMAIEAVLFDYSGVLTTGLHLPTEDVPYDPDALLTEMINSLTTTEPDPWQELERGEISLSAYLAHVEAKVSGASALLAADSPSNVMGSLQLLEDRLAVAEELKQRGLRVGLVTNNVAEWRPLWRPRLPPELFEIVIDSAEVGCRKPEPAIYELALEQLGLTDPSTVVFVDDFEWNVTGATDIGMVGVHCTADIDLRAALEAVLVEQSA